MNEWEWHLLEDKPPVDRLLVNGVELKIGDRVKLRPRPGGDILDMALADKVSDAWIAFARTGDPNTPKLPRWPRFNAKDRPTMVINNESKVENDPIREQRLAMFAAWKYA